MPSKHKWADVIHAYADGATIQVRHALVSEWPFKQSNSDWQDVGNPGFFDGFEYRVKPEDVRQT